MTAQDLAYALRRHLSIDRMEADGEVSKVGPVEPAAPDVSLTGGPWKFDVESQMDGWYTVTVERRKP